MMFRSWMNKDVPVRPFLFLFSLILLLRSLCGNTSAEGVCLALLSPQFSKESPLPFGLTIAHGNEPAIMWSMLKSERKLRLLITPLFIAQSYCEICARNEMLGKATSNLPTFTPVKNDPSYLKKEWARAFTVQIISYNTPRNEWQVRRTLRH